jgi:NAD(P) transhydrogenase subunit beta
MPQMVALYNGMGGGAAAAIAAVELLRATDHALVPLLVTVIGALIGSISLSGSLIAWAKLDGKIDKTWRMRGQQALNGAFFLATLAIGFYIVFFAQGHADPRLVAAFFVGALIFGV